MSPNRPPPTARGRCRPPPPPASQVHPILGKMLLLAGLFQCAQPLLTICAALGYKSPFVCPLGKEREADEAKQRLAGGSGSDHIALARAYEGWRAGGARFAQQHFLSPQTLGYIHRLRGDLTDTVRDVLTHLPRDHDASPYLLDVCRAVLVAGLYPNVAQLRRFGKGETLQGLKVKAHPGSVNSRASRCIVVFYEIQETTDRWLYDTTGLARGGGEGGAAVCVVFGRRDGGLGGWVGMRVKKKVCVPKTGLSFFALDSTFHFPERGGFFGFGRGGGLAGWGGGGPRHHPPPPPTPWEGRRGGGRGTWGGEEEAKKDKAQ